MKIKLWTATALAVACSAWLVLHAAEKKPSKSPPSKDFVEGFEAGVRYGLAARAAKPKENSIPKLTEEAKKLYWIIVVDEGKTLIDRGTKSPDKEH